MLASYGDDMAPDWVRLAPGDEGGLATRICGIALDRVGKHDELVVDGLLDVHGCSVSFFFGIFFWCGCG